MKPGIRSINVALAGAEAVVAFEPVIAGQRLLLGKTPEAAVALVGLVHNLCPEAHRAACRAATGLEVSTESARGVMLEILREHLFVLCRSAPPLLGLEPVSLPVPFSRLDTVAAPAGRALRDRLGKALFGELAGADFNAAVSKSGSPLAPFFGALDARERAAGLRARDIVLPSDPSFYARVKRDRRFVLPKDCGPVSARMLARLYEVQRLLAAFGRGEETGYGPKVDETGGARVEAARGQLVHRATVRGGAIVAYAIETPTAAMLEADGPLGNFLNAVARPETADEALVRLALLAFGPCLAYTVNIREGVCRRLANA